MSLAVWDPLSMAFWSLGEIQQERLMFEGEHIRVKPGLQAGFWRFPVPWVSFFGSIWGADFR